MRKSAVSYDHRILGVILRLIQEALLSLRRKHAHEG